jgi:hypothetical protein
MVVYIGGEQGWPMGGEGKTRPILGCENGKQAKWRYKMAVCAPKT